MRRSSIIMTENKQVSKTKDKVSLVCSYRLFLALLAFSGVFLCYAQRREEFLYGEINFSNESERVNGTAIISFALGYVLTHVPSSIAVNLIGPQRFFALIIFLSSIFTGLLPIFRHAHVTMLLCFSIGATQGGLWPTIFRFWSTWAPASERTTLLSFQIAGPSTSVIVILIIFNRLNKFSLTDNVPFIHRYGWIYYCIFGCLGIIWSIIWLIFASDTPATNKYISAKEKEYIRVCKIDERTQDIHTKTPWRSIFQSRDFWCIIITMFFREMGVYALWIVVPKYMNEVLLFDISKNDRLFGLLHIAVFIGIIFTGISADFLIRNKYLKHVNTRKIFHSIGALGTTICLLLVLFLDYKHFNLSVCLYIIGLVLNDCMKSGGYFVNILDFSGVHSSVVLALGEALSSIGTLCAFRLTNFIVKHETAAEWRMASIISTTSFILSAFVFLVFARGKLASWARSEQIDNEELMEIDSI